MQCEMLSSLEVGGLCIVASRSVALRSFCEAGLTIFPVDNPLFQKIDGGGFSDPARPMICTKVPCSFAIATFSRTFQYRIAGSPGVVADVWHCLEPVVDLGPGHRNLPEKVEGRVGCFSSQAAKNSGSFVRILSGKSARINVFRYLT